MNTVSQADLERAMQESANKPVTWGSWLLTFGVSAAILIAGLALSVLAYNLLRDGFASSGWPTAEGKVLSSSISQDENSNGDETYMPHVEYTYVVNGNTYTSTQIQFFPESSENERDAASVTNKFREGKTVPVYYYPDNPGNAVLIPGPSGGPVVMLGIGVVLTAIGALILILLFVTTFKRMTSRSAKTTANTNLSKSKLATE